MLTTQAHNMYKYIFLIFLFIYFFEDTKGKISTQHHTIVKKICFPNGNVLFLSLFSLSKSWMHNVVWGCPEILPTLEWKIVQSLWNRYKHTTWIWKRSSFHYKIRTEKNSVLSCTGLEHKNSTIPMLCSTNWAKNPTRSWSQFWFQVNPWSDE